MSIHFDMSMDQYLAHPGESSSGLKHILFTPADYRAAKDSGQSDETKFTILGEAIHTAILEPDYMFDRFAFQPADWGPKNKKPASTLWRNFKIENSDKKIIDFKDAQLIHRIHKAASYCEPLGEYLEHGRAEVTAFTKIQMGKLELQLKARTDLLYDPGHTLELLDVKSTSEAIDDDSIFKTIFNNGYHFQAAHHAKVIEAELGRKIENVRWVFVTTQSKAIHIRIVLCPAELLAWGRRDHAFALERLAECIYKDEWPGYPAEVNDLRIPDWVRRIYE